MKLKEEDKTLLRELCLEYGVKYEKVLMLIEAVKEYEFKDRRIGIYNTLRRIIAEED